MGAKLTMVTVSVVIPTYNRAEVLPRAIDSVLDQTYDDFKIIVVDDGSTDNTEDVVTSYSDDRVKYVFFEDNKGANTARNEGVRRSQGEYISFLDSDDEFHPNHLEKVVDALKSSSSGVGGVFTSFKIVNSHKTTNISNSPDEKIKLEDIVSGNIVGGFSAVTVRKAAFTTVGLLDEEMLSSQDYEFFIRLLCDYSLLGISETLLTYHTDSKQRISDSIDRKIAGQERVLEKHNEKLTSIGRARMYSSRAYLYAKNGAMKNARQDFRYAIQENPINILAYYYLIAALLGTQGFSIAIGIKSRIKRVIDSLRKPFSSI